MGLPSIVVDFVDQANTAITRSQRGTVALVVNDATKPADLTEYSSILDVKQEDWTAESYSAIDDAFKGGIRKLYVARLGAEATFEDARASLDTIKFDWLAHISSTQSAVTAYIKERNLKDNIAKVKAVVFKQAADDEHIVNFTNAKITRKDEKEVDGYKYLGRICGLLAGLPMTRSATYYELDDLVHAVEPADLDAAVNAGEFVLFNDYGPVKVARAVNSATTTEKEDLKKIAVIEAMDLIKNDISSTFKKDFVGKYKNNLDNQSVFVASVNTYFRRLADEEILDNEFANIAEINIPRQRQAWIDSGKTEAMDWSDEEVKKMSYKNYVFLSGKVKILDAIEDLEFHILMA